jgi:hypothetical protein
LRSGAAAEEEEEEEEDSVPSFEEEKETTAGWTAGWNGLRAGRRCRCGSKACSSFIRSKSSNCRRKGEGPQIVISPLLLDHSSIVFLLL